jgi:hypothetical protein
MIRFNDKKSNLVHYRKPSCPLTTKTFYLGENTLSVVKQYKYLGIIFDEFLDYNVTAKVLADAGNRALGAIIAKYKKINGFGYYTFTKLFNSCVCPILDYCSEVWGYRRFNQIDAVQNKAVRIFLGVHKFAPLNAIHGDMGWTSSEVRRKVAMCRFWNRIISMKENRLPHIILKWDINIGYVNSWSNNVKELMYKLDMGHNYENKELVSVNNVWALLHESFSNEWNNRILMMPKLRTYINFKNSYKVEPYVLSLMSRQKRSYLAQFRCGILPLQLEVGRWSNKEEEERLCLVCKNGHVENENHFIFVCTFYHMQRLEFFTNVSTKVIGFTEMSNVEKLQLFMSKEFVSDFSTYLCKIFQMRQDKIFV